MGCFYFKGFSVEHSRSAIKVNSDGVLLAAWSSLEQLLGDSVDGALDTPSVGGLASSKVEILDVGSGTGVIALLIAKRLSQLSSTLNYNVTGVEIDFDAWEESLLNFHNSPWSGRLSAINGPFQQLANEEERLGTFNLLLSNPPFFSRSLKPNDARRSIGRHEESLTLEELIVGGEQLMAEGALLSLILPIDNFSRLERVVGGLKTLSLKRVCRVVTVEGKAPKRVMVEIVKRDPSGTQLVGKEDSEMAGGGVTELVAKKGSNVVEEVLIMHNRGSLRYTEEYVELVGPYYLKELNRGESL